MINFWIITLACTYSMYPTFTCDSDLHAYQLQEWQNPIIGDVYIYKYNESLNISHRLIDINNRGYIFKGDNNPYPDYPVQREDIIFKVINVVPKGETT